MPKKPPKKAFQAYVAQLCKGDVSEEWKKADDRKIAKLGKILNALQEESQSTQLLKKESEDRVAQRELEDRRHSVGERLAGCRAREAEHERKQEELRLHVLDSEQFIRDAEANIRRDQMKIDEINAECRKLDEEIRHREMELENEKQLHNEEVSTISRMSQYKEFLEATVQECDDDFDGDVDALINRHHTLASGNQELHATNVELTSRLDKKREEWQTEQTNLTNTHLMISSQLHTCRMNYERFRRESQELEAQLNRALEEKELKESHIGIINMAIEQLFTRIVQTCGLPQRKKAISDMIDSKYGHRLDLMLLAITERVEDLQDIHQKAHEALRLDEKRGREEVEDYSVLPRVEFVTKGAANDAGQQEGASSKFSPSEASRSLVAHQSGGGGAATSEKQHSSGAAGDTFITE